MNLQHQELNIDGHRLAAICLNPGANGEPVILIHGITGTIFSWQVNPAKFVLDIGPCYALSLPGHFPAIAPNDFRNQPLTAEYITDLLREGIRQLVGDKPVLLFGHSTGGFAALALAARYPDLAQRVISVSGFSHGRWMGILGFYQQIVRMGWLGEAYYKSMYRALMLHASLYRWAMRFYAADRRSLYANPDTDEAIKRTFHSFRQLDLDAMIRYFKDMPQIDIMPQLANIQAKTLLVTGDRDPIVSPTQSIAASKSIRNAKLEIIAGAGHLPFIERPMEYTAALSRWIE
jgi:pimeloyl-ACP methyl ester carboxylesterase